jgi:hypothetical protein
MRRFPQAKLRPPAALGRASAPKLACQPATCQWALRLGAQPALDPNRAVVLDPGGPRARRASAPGQSRRPAAGPAPGVTVLSWRRRCHAPPAGKQPCQCHPGRAAAAAVAVSSYSLHA